MKLKAWVREALEGITCLTFFGVFIFIFWLIFGVQS